MHVWVHVNDVGVHVVTNDVLHCPQMVLHAKKNNKRVCQYVPIESAQITVWSNECGDIKTNVSY